jgi:molybdate transport system regulatory protein
VSERQPPRLDLHMRLATPDAPPIGPGKIALLESIARTGSISGAAREHGMAYTRAWKLVTEVNAAFGEALVETAAGGASGGGAVLTALAEDLIAAYREAEAAGRRAAEVPLRRVLRKLATPGS